MKNGDRKLTCNEWGGRENKQKQGSKKSSKTRTEKQTQEAGIGIEGQDRQDQPTKNGRKGTTGQGAGAAHMGREHTG